MRSVVSVAKRSRNALMKSNITNGVGGEAGAVLCGVADPYLPIDDTGKTARVGVVPLRKGERFRPRLETKPGTAASCSWARTTCK